MSTTITKPDQVLDLKGLLCPMPIVRLSIAVKKAGVGAVLEGIATDPGVMADVPAWARQSGNELVSIKQQGKEYHFLVKKTK
ncbi:MAG: sulfurtransferase TusA family protein [Chloroflexi bacterium]|nr:sulfurtransferase TusA family protein [Chloroflexota bacterium]